LIPDRDHVPGSLYKNQEGKTTGRKKTRGNRGGERAALVGLFWVTSSRL